VIAAAARQGASADRIAAEWFRARRFVGSKDRRAIRELAWNAIRACGEAPASGRAAVLRLAAEDPRWPPFRWFDLWSRADRAG
jgi:16S rRNA (cytosine967-C5)-methyltransferase